MNESNSKAQPVDVYIEGSGSKFKLRDDTIVDLSIMDEWNRLSAEQKRYCAEYCRTLKRTVSAFVTGVSPARVNGWLTEADFTTVIDTIESLHRDTLAGADYDQSYFAPDRRNHVLKALKHEGYMDKSNKPVTDNRTLNVFVFNGKKQEKMHGAVNAAKQIASSVSGDQD